MNNDMLPVGTTVHINPEDIKWDGGDLISREALKKSIKSYADDQYAENEYLGEYAIMDIINNAPAVNNEIRPQGKWIPVSERLPETNMMCLVAVGKINLTQIAVYSDLMGTINRKVFYRGDYGHENFEDITQYVKAWQPLPEAYKEGEEK